MHTLKIAKSSFLDNTLYEHTELSHADMKV